jgi:hypothetical protein
MPTARTAVYVHASAMHHSGSEWSFVATRGPDGIWRANRVAEDTGGLLAAPAKWRPYYERALDEESSRQLDRLVANECLYLEPTFTKDKNSGVGAWHVTGDVVSADRRFSFSGVGRIPGLTGKVVDLIAGHQTD